MLPISTKETFQDGEIIFEEGASGDWVYVVLSGAVELTKRVEHHPVVIDLVRPEGIFGELGFISRSPRAATARSVGETTLGIVDRSFLHDQYGRLSEDFTFILEQLALRLKKITEIAMRARTRRADSRVTKELSLDFKTEKGLAKAFTEDVSIGGMFVRTRKPLPKWELFTLKLRLPGTAEPLSIGCEVAWTRPESQATESQPAGMGVRFLQISEVDHYRLKEELKRS